MATKTPSRVNGKEYNFKLFIRDVGLFFASY